MEEYPEINLQYIVSNFKCFKIDLDKQSKSTNFEIIFVTLFANLPVIDYYGFSRFPHLHPLFF